MFRAALRSNGWHGLFILAGALAVACLAPPPAARAAGIGECNQYVIEALAAAREVRDRKCGFDENHPQWSFDAAGHMRWCRSALQESVDREIANRRSQLNLCRRCSVYSDTAVRLAGANTMVLNHCGFEGAAWSKDRAAHFNWCMAADQESIDREAAQRSERIGRCEACRKYESKAVSQVKQFRWTCSGDLPNEPRWSERKPNHFYWCMRVDNYMPMIEEDQAREAMLEACERTKKQNQSLINVPPEPEPKTRKSRSTVSAVKSLGDPRKPVGKSSTQVNTVVPNPCKPGAPCSRSKIINPGILETEQGFARQAPSATGTPIPSAPAASSPGISVFKE